MDIQNLSSQYTVRDLHPEDAAIVYEVLKHNTIFYQYHPPMVTVESIIEDMEALPPGKVYEDKHYIGFFQDASLVAVMDLIENYPGSGTALIGFFAMNTDFQGKESVPLSFQTVLIAWHNWGLKKYGSVLTREILKAKHFGQRMVLN